MLQKILYSLAEVETMVAAAYQNGVNYGYMMAVKEDTLELEARKREQEREAIINWQGICESREGDECGHES
jgi:archaellum biogenesis protein FlaJ (TadC family)